MGYDSVDKLQNLLASEVFHYTKHGSRLIAKSNLYEKDIPLSCGTIIKKYFAKDKSISKTGMIIDKNKVIKNAFVLLTRKNSFVTIYINSYNSSYTIYELRNKPFAIFECKRVGVEEGMKKWPQTIEKAKQGSYVAKNCFIIAENTVWLDDSVVSYPSTEFHNLRGKKQGLVRCVADCAIRISTQGEDHDYIMDTGQAGHRSCGTDF